MAKGKDKGWFEEHLQLRPYSRGRCHVTSVVTWSEQILLCHEFNTGWNGVGAHSVTPFQIKKAANLQKGFLLTCYFWHLRFSDWLRFWLCSNLGWQPLGCPPCHLDFDLFLARKNKAQVSARWSKKIPDAKECLKSQNTAIFFSIDTFTESTLFFVQSFVTSVLVRLRFFVFALNKYRICSLKVLRALVAILLDFVFNPQLFVVFLLSKYGVFFTTLSLWVCVWTKSIQHLSQRVCQLTLVKTKWTSTIILRKAWWT